MKPAMRHTGHHRRELALTDEAIDEAAHEGVLKIFDFESEGEDLIAEGKTAAPSGWTFRR